MYIILIVEIYITCLLRKLKKITENAFSRVRQRILNYQSDLYAYRSPRIFHEEYASSTRGNIKLRRMTDCVLRNIYSVTCSVTKPDIFALPHF